MVAERERGPTLPAVRLSVGACMISCRPRTPKRDNVINIVVVVMSSATSALSAKRRKVTLLFEGQIES